MKMYECKKCGKRAKSAGGIRGHVWRKHRNRGKDKKPIHKGKDFITVDVLTEADFVSNKTGMEALDEKILVTIITTGMSTVQKIAFNELMKRTKKEG